MNSEELRLQKGDSDDLKDNDDDLKTPTIEELTFPGQQVVSTFSCFSGINIY